MNCAFHPESPNIAFCIHCGRALCNECVRNIRGSVYCENCLAEFVVGKGTTPSPAATEKMVAETHPGIAFALGLIPGVGAIYNGEFVKAAVHVLIFGTLISLAPLTHNTGPGPLFHLFIFVFYVYMPFEAYYTAKKKKLGAEGVELQTPIDRLQQHFGEVKDRELWGGIALVVIGALFLLSNLSVLDLSQIARVWPIALVVAGAWLLKKHQEKTV